MRARSFGGTARQKSPVVYPVWLESVKFLLLRLFSLPFSHHFPTALLLAFHLPLKQEKHPTIPLRGYLAAFCLSRCINHNYASSVLKLRPLLDVFFFFANLETGGGKSGVVGVVDGATIFFSTLRKHG